MQYHIVPEVISERSLQSAPLLPTLLQAPPANNSTTNNCTTSNPTANNCTTNNSTASNCTTSMAKKKWQKIRVLHHQARVRLGLFNQAAVLTSESIHCVNGIIYPVDALLLPPLDALQTVERLTGLTPMWSQFLMAAYKTDLAHDLGKKSLTLFLPINAAFEILPPHRQQELFNEYPPRKLKSLLQFHMAKHPLYLNQLAPGEERTLATWHKKSRNKLLVRRSSDGKKWWVNDVRILFPDIPVQNGVIHIVSRVLSQYFFHDPALVDPIDTSSIGMEEREREGNNER